MEHPPAFLPGLTARVELTVTDSDTAQTLGSGDVPVLGTPRVVALAEAATVAATAVHIGPGKTTVGVQIELEHKLASPIGRTVVAQAILAKVDGRRLFFDITVTELPASPTVPYQDRRVVAEGRVERLLVDRQRFLDRAFDG